MIKRPGRMRRRLIDAAETLEKEGAIPPGVVDPTLYHCHGEQALGSDEGTWKMSYARMMAELYATQGQSTNVEGGLKNG